MSQVPLAIGSPPPSMDDTNNLIAAMQAQLGELQLQLQNQQEQQQRLQQQWQQQPEESVHQAIQAEETEQHVHFSGEEEMDEDDLAENQQDSNIAAYNSFLNLQSRFLSGQPTTTSSLHPPLKTPSLLLLPLLPSITQPPVNNNNS